MAQDPNEDKPDKDKDTSLVFCEHSSNHLTISQTTLLTTGEYLQIIPNNIIDTTGVQNWGFKRMSIWICAIQYGN